MLRLLVRFDFRVSTVKTLITLHLNGPYLVKISKYENLLFISMTTYMWSNFKATTQISQFLVFPLGKQNLPKTFILKLLLKILRSKIGKTAITCGLPFTYFLFFQQAPHGTKWDLPIFPSCTQCIIEGATINGSSLYINLFASYCA